MSGRAATAAELLAALHREGEHVAICHNGSGHFRADVVPAGAPALIAVAERGEQGDVWHGVNPIRPDVARRGTADDVTRLAALWADLDVKAGGMPSWEAARAVIADLSAMLECPPSFVVVTGHGLHPYWILDDDERLRLDTPGKRAGAQAILARWRRLVTRVAVAHGGTVDAVFDLPRVLRTPGTLNRKDAEPLPVTVEAGDGWPLDVGAILETFEAYGVPELEADAATWGPPVAPQNKWPDVETTCNYVTQMIAGWQGDPVTGGRHYWAFSQHVRLACAARLGCVTPSDYRHALGALQGRLDVLRAGDGRRPGEVAANDRDALTLAERKTEDQARAELGHHEHREPLDVYATELPPHTQGQPLAHGNKPEEGDEPAAPGASWRPVDLSATVARLVAGTLTRPAPTVGTVEGGGALFYAGKVNGVAGASGSGKSWTALHTAAQVIATGGHALYVDLEDDGPGIVSRLLDMGADPADVLARFHYVHPDEPHGVAAAAELAAVVAEFAPALVVIDSTGESMALDGDKPNDDDDTARWFRRLPAAVAKLGPAVVVLDHVVKAEDGGLWPIGSQRKRAAISGAQYMQLTVKPFARDVAGVAKLVCAKDRHGNYRQGQRVADLRVSPSPGGVVVALAAAETDSTPTAATGGTFRPTALMERVSRALEAAGEPLSGREIDEGVKGKSQHVRAAVGVLVDEGYVSRREAAGNSRLHELVRPYRQSEDPHSDLFTGARPVRPRPIDGGRGRTHSTSTGTHTGHTGDAPDNPRDSNDSGGTHTGRTDEPESRVRPAVRPADSGTPTTGPGYCRECGVTGGHTRRCEAGKRASA